MTQADLFEQNMVEEEIRYSIELLLSRHCLSSCEQFVVRTLYHKRRFGKENAMSIRSLQDYAMQPLPSEVFSDRSIKQAVKTLVEDHNIPIGSCRVAPNYGYFFCMTDGDAEDAVRPLKNEIYSLFARIKVLSPKSKFVRQLQGQLQLLKENTNDVDR